MTTENTVNENGAISLLIYGEELDFDTVNKDMGVEFTAAYHKGDKINRQRNAVRTFWEYRLEFDSLNKMENTLIHFFDTLKNAAIKKYSNYDVRLRLYIQSDMSQIFFTMPEAVLKSASELGIPFDISVLSWGEVDD